MFLNKSLSVFGVRVCDACSGVGITCGSVLDCRTGITADQYGEGQAIPTFFTYGSSSSYGSMMRREVSVEGLAGDFWMTEVFACRPAVAPAFAPAAFVAGSSYGSMTRSWTCGGR